MKRNSTTIFIESESGNAEYPYITSVPWDGSPVWDSFTEPTLSVLKAAYERDKANIVVVPNPVPQPIAIEVREIDARRLRLALLQLGKLSMVKTAIASLGEAAQIDWEYATFVKEDYPLVMALSTNLGLDINAIFTKAESLE